ncbi:hypothetical protein QJS10_CPB13g00197 [Acorus calamus]|uniref:HHO5-like N-terminal domain-containing protein n=1 Tax=Acorus calamus TaxID=4465 RepID=A0AAV9DJW9_ACOCL|nr:hypothetical protein QJS10_CPB13g00197 [Acorus calamus]
MGVEMKAPIDRNRMERNRVLSEILSEVYAGGKEKMEVSHAMDLRRRIKEEIRKIKPFQPELPLCMALLNEAIDAFNIILEEDEQKRWMSSAQIWSVGSNGKQKEKFTDAEENHHQYHMVHIGCPRRTGGAGRPCSTSDLLMLFNISAVQKKYRMHLRKSGRSSTSSNRQTRVWEPLDLKKKVSICSSRDSFQLHVLVIKNGCTSMTNGLPFHLMNG